MGNTSTLSGPASISGARLDHVAFGVKSMRDAAAFMVGTLGGVPHEGGPGPGYTGAQWRFANGARLELIEPAGDDGFLHRFLRARGPGVHHVTFIVPELALAAKVAMALGYEVVGYNDTYPSWKECFLHPKQAQGIVVQMAEKSGLSDEGNTWSSAFAFPDVPRVAPQASIRALRLAAPSRESAMRQWGTLLGGEPEELGTNLLAFRWVESPIRLEVRIDPQLTVGPVHLEVDPDRSLRALDEEPSALGARFVGSVRR